MKNLWIWGIVVPGLILVSTFFYIADRDRRQEALQQQSAVKKRVAVARPTPTSKYTSIIGRVRFEEGTPLADYYVIISPRMACYSDPFVEAWRAERREAAVKEGKRLTKLGKNYSEQLLLMSGPYSHAHTGAKGEYRFTNLAETSYCISLWDDVSGWTTKVVEIKTKYKTPVRAPDIVLTRGAIVQGRVFDQKTNQPLAGVHISCYGPHKPIYDGGDKTVTTDEKGRYKMRVAPGTSMFWISGGEQRADYPIMLKVNGRPYSTFITFLKGNKSLYALGPAPDSNIPGKFPFQYPPAPIRCLLDGVAQNIRPDVTDWIEVETKKGQNRTLDFGLRPSPLLTAKQRATLKFSNSSMSLYGGQAEQLMYER